MPPKAAAGAAGNNNGSFPAACLQFAARLMQARLVREEGVLISSFTWTILLFHCFYHFCKELNHFGRTFFYFLYQQGF